MTTVIINERTAKGKSLIDFLRKFEGENFVQIGKEPAKSEYNPEFVKEIQISRASKGKIINPEDLWK